MGSGPAEGRREGVHWAAGAAGGGDAQQVRWRRSPSSVWSLRPPPSLELGEARLGGAQDGVPVAPEPSP
eukprot:7284710-Alexandrium_andersonii.AAC.1